MFGNDGRFVMTNLAFPNEPSSTLSISTDGGEAKLSSLNVYPINVK